MNEPEISVKQQAGKRKTRNTAMTKWPIIGQFTSRKADRTAYVRTSEVHAASDF